MVRRLRLIPPILIGAYAVLCVVGLRNLHADGAYAYLRSLLSEGYWIGDPYRIVTDLLAQTPVATAMAMGVDDRSVLAYVHGLGYIVIPSLAWVGALLLARNGRTFELLLLAYCATTLNSGFLAVGEFNYLFSFTALAFAATIHYWDRPQRRLAWLLFAASIVVASSHGLALLLAPLLLATLLLPWRLSGPPPVGRLPVLLSAAALCVGTVSAGASVLRPYSPGNVVRAADLATPLSANLQLQITIVWLALLPFAVLAGSAAVRRTVSGILVIALVLLIFDEALWSTPTQQYEARVWSGIVMFLLLVVALSTWLPSVRKTAPETPPPWQPRLTALALALFIALLIPAAAQTIEFGRFVRSFHEVVNATTGQLSNAELHRLIPSATRYGWPWTYPTLSLVLGTTPGHALVLNPADTVWQPPFSPDDPPVLPSRFAPR
jgi:hypothetical protein